MMDHAPSVEIAKFICCREAYVRVAYPDGEFADGAPRYSVAFGSQTPRVSAGAVVEIDEAWPRLWEDLRTRSIDINRKLKVKLLQQEFDAVLSEYYRSGTKFLNTVGDLFNAGKNVEAIATFIQFNKNGKGEVKDGLTRRCIKEMGLADDGDYSDLSQFPYYDGDPKRVPRQWRPFPENIQ